MPGKLILHVQVPLDEPRGKHACGPASRNLDFRTGAFATSHGEYYGLGAQRDGPVLAYEPDKVGRARLALFMAAVMLFS